MRYVWVVAVLAGCYQSFDHQQVVIVDSSFAPDGPVLHDATTPQPDAAFFPDAYVPDARPDAPAPAVCGDGTRAPGEVCFGTPLTIDAGELVYSARLLDVDGDGKRDLLYLTRTNVVVRRGDGAGHFAAPVTGPATDSWWISAGDIDGDGITDLAATGRQLLTVWLGTGGGAFGPPHTSTLPDGPVALEIADVDGYPGNEIIVLTGQSFYVITWFVNDVEQLYGAGEADAMSLAVGDIDRDGRSDMVVLAGSYCDRFRGTVDGASYNGYINTPGTGAGVALGNVDQDPSVDGIVAFPGLAEIGIYSKVQNAPDETTTHQYATEIWPVTSGAPRFVAAADLDTDGISEVIAGMPDTMRLQLFHPGGAAGATFQLAEPMTSQVFDGDANGDGIADLVVTLQDQIVVLPSAAP